MRRQQFAGLLLFFVLVLWAGSSWAATIGLDNSLSIARLVVLPEDGSGIPAADAIQFNTGFTMTSFFGLVACYVRTIMEVVR